MRRKVKPDLRQLKDLVSVGPATLKDFLLLGIHEISDLKRCQAQELYQRLCTITKTRHDPCVEDVFKAAIEQAKIPDLDQRKKNWWYWSQVRKKKIK